MSKRRRTTQKIHVADALVSIVVGRDGMADIRCGRDVEPEYVGAYLTELARRFNANEPGAPLAHSETCIVREHWCATCATDLRIMVRQMPYRATEPITGAMPLIPVPSKVDTSDEGQVTP